MHHYVTPCFLSLRRWRALKDSVTVKVTIRGRVMQLGQCFLGGLHLHSKTNQQRKISVGNEFLIYIFTSLCHVNVLQITGQHCEMVPWRVNYYRKKFIKTVISVSEQPMIIQNRRDLFSQRRHQPLTQKTDLESSNSPEALQFRVVFQ